MQELSKIKELKLKLRKCSGLGSLNLEWQVEKLFSPHAERLKKLSLGLSGIRAVNTMDLQSAINGLLVKCQKLEELELLFDRDNMDGLENAGFVGMTSAFSSLAKLKELTLNIRDSFVDSEGLSKFSEHLRSLQALTSLNLNLRGVKKSDENSLKKIAESIQELTNLEELCLNF